MKSPAKLAILTTGSRAEELFLIAGLLTQLPQDFFGFLLEVQNKLAKVIKSVGKIEHSLYPFQFSRSLFLLGVELTPVLWCLAAPGVDQKSGGCETKPKRGELIHLHKPPGNRRTLTL